MIDFDKMIDKRFIRTKLEKLIVDDFYNLTSIYFLNLKRKFKHKILIFFFKISNQKMDRKYI